MPKIVLLDNHMFTKHENHERVVVSNKRTADYVYITPHSKENYENLGLVKLKIYCDESNIKIISSGHKNQLPLLSMVSDEIYLVDYPEYYQGIYGGKYKLTSWKTPDLFKYKKVKIEGAKVFNHEANNVDKEKIKNYLTNSKVFIRKESFEIFQAEKSNLPTDIIICEIKKCDFRTKLINQSNFIGLDYTFQQSLVKRFRYHYMSLQILASFILNWYYLCIGGAANLFSILPVKCLIMGDSCLEESYDLLKEIYKNVPKIVYKYKNDESLEEIMHLYQLRKNMNENLEIESPRIKLFT